MLDSHDAVNMLFLSGGGSLGAYGAGVINGWTKAVNAHKRPLFDVVTGVSTGALQATHVFLAGAAHDDMLYDLYTQHENLMPPRPFWELLTASSINSTKPLRAIIDKTVPDSTIDAVGALHGQRVLCVGTVNLDTGRFVAWDMTAIAADTTDATRYDRYRNVLLASASVPVASSPVKIDGAPHADGGVRSQIFAVNLIKQVRKRTKSAAGNDHAYFIVNHKLSVDAQCTVPTLGGIAERTVRLVINQGLISALDEADRLVHEAGCGTDPATHYLAIPEEYPLKITDADFIKDEMCRLYCRGKHDGLNGLWQDAPPHGSATPQCGSAPYLTGDLLADSTCPPLATGSDVCPTSYPAQTIVTMDHCDPVF